MDRIQRMTKRLIVLNKQKMVAIMWWLKYGQHTNQNTNVVFDSVTAQNQWSKGYKFHL